MGLGNYPLEVLSQIQGITSHLLTRFTRDQIVKSFLGVAKVIADFKLNHPDKVPTWRSGGGLLDVDVGPIPINDFELAQHLIGTSDPEMAKVINESEGVPVLIAYLEVIANSRVLPNEFLLTSALPYAVLERTVAGDFAEHWNKELQPLAVRALKLDANQAIRRTGKTKLSESKKRQIVREYEAAPVTYGMIKSLARKYEVSDDTISRIVNAKPIHKETKQD